MTAYYEVVISGSFLYVKGLIRGICIGAGEKPEIIFNKDHNIETETLTEVLKEFIGLSEILVHSILPEKLCNLIKSKLSDKTADVKIKSIKKIKSAQFEFNFEAYSKKHKDEIKKILDNPPGDVKFSDDTTAEERVHKTSEGIEVYAPAHDFEYIGKGKVSGSFPDIFDLYKKCEAHPLIEVGKMQLTF